MAQLVTERPNEAISRGPSGSGTGEPILPTRFLLILREGVVWDSCCRLCSTCPYRQATFWLVCQWAGKGVATVTPGCPPGWWSSLPGLRTMKCSLRVWFLSVVFLLVFIMSLLFTYSHHSMATLPYLDSGALGGTHRVKLVPGYAGLQRLSKEGLTGKSCACRRCMGDTGASDWFDSHFDSNISPVWTRENMDLPPDVQKWWMVREPWPPAYPCCSSPGICPTSPFGSHS